MTTIAYKDGMIAYDSRRIADDVIIDDSVKKHHEVNDSHFFVAGSVSIGDLNNLFNADYEGFFNSDTIAFRISEGHLYLRLFYESKCYEYELDKNKHYAIGSGKHFAIAAMDMGKSAEEAVMYSTTRDCFTGGKVNVFSINDKAH